MTERQTKYSTANENGMEFIGNRWVYAGDKGYKVKAQKDGSFSVVRYNANGERPLYGGDGFSEDGAHELAASLAEK